jgi:hypothetical protein
MNLVLQTLLVLLLFIFAGGEKIFSLGSTAKTLQSKVPLPLALCMVVIVGVIVLEIVGPGIIVYSASTGSQKKLAQLAIMALVAFTVLATLLFHMSDPGDILKNLSVIGALALLYEKFD